MSDPLSSLFGSKPSVPPWIPISLGTSQAKAIKANQNALPADEQLISSANTFTEQQITQMLQMAIPGYSEMVGQTGKNISSLLKGELPPDVANAIQDSAAAQALTGGFGGTGLAGNLTARDLGLTSLGLMGEGFSMEESWMNLAASIYEPSMLNVASMFISPEQQFAADFQNEEMQVEQQWLANQVAAMPDPVVAGVATTTLNMLLGGLPALESGGKSLGQAGGAGNNPSATYSGGGNVGPNNLSSGGTTFPSTSTGYIDAGSYDTGGLNFSSQMDESGGTSTNTGSIAGLTSLLSFV